jgi:hypothetical protein
LGDGQIKWATRAVPAIVICITFSAGAFAEENYEVWLSGKKVELREQTASFPLEGVLQKPTDR